jgi:hypothetical protein
MAARKTGKRPAKASPDPARLRPLQRRVYYVAGFDPASPKKYHRLYAEQSERQGALTGVRYDVGELLPIDEVSSGWTVTAIHPDGRKVEVDYRFLHWFDLVREVWPKDEPWIFVRFVKALLDYRDAGLLAVAKEKARVVWLTALAPVVVVGGFLFSLTLAVAVLMAAGALAAKALHLPWFAGALPPLALYLLLMPLWRWVDALLPVGWEGRGMIGVTRAARGDWPSFAQRASEFAKRLAAAEYEGGYDEILVVAHSMGGQQACRALGRAVMLNPSLGKLRRVRLLTLGSLLPFYSICEAWAGGDPDYREEMKALVEADWIEWLDVTAPADAGCAAALNPLEGLALGEPKGRPHRRSPRFNDILSAETVRRLKKAPLDYHFQYIMAAERPGEFDFFALTAGPEPITRMVQASRK